MKKQLLIVGAYTTTFEEEDMLYETISRLYTYFDIALVTHAPVPKHIQNRVKYFIYDSRNELMDGTLNTVFWGSNDKFYYEIHPSYDRKYHGFAVYRSITNAIKMLSRDYDSFVYVEGDCHFSPKDALVLQNMKKLAAESGKHGVFTSYKDFLATTAFYCSMDFFERVFGFYNNTNEYMQRCNQIGSHGLLENFLYKSALYNNAIDRILVIDGCNSPPMFSSDSIIDKRRFNGKNVVENTPYTIDVLRLNDSDEIAIIYIPPNGDSKPVSISLDDEYLTHIAAFPGGTILKINPKNTIFSIKVNDTKFSYDKSRILNKNNKSFIKMRPAS